MNHNIESESTPVVQLLRLLGCTKAFAAHQRLIDPDEAISQLKVEVLKFTDANSFSEFVRCKAIPLGIDTKPTVEAING